MKAVVATTNKHKLGGVQQAFEESSIFRRSLKIEGRGDVESQVASMPMTLEETMLGARNRAINLIGIVDADLHLGIEGGAWKEDLGLGTCLGNVAYILDNSGNGYYGHSETVDIHPVIACQLEDTGRDLLDIMKEIYPNDKFILQGDVSGFLTQGKLTRQKLVYQSVVNALAQLLSDIK